MFQISSLEKECRDAQRRLFDIQRERDEGSSQLRKVEAERNELRKRVNEVNIIRHSFRMHTTVCILKEYLIFLTLTDQPHLHVTDQLENVYFFKLSTYN